MRKIALGLLLLALTACGAAGTPAGDSTGATTGGNTGSGDVTTGTGQQPAGGDQPMTMPVPSGVATGDLSGGSAELQKNVASLLATTTGLPVEKLQLQNAEATEWPNGALGCPKEGMMYTEMIVPGFKLTFTDGAQTYEVHTDQTGQNAILCDKGNPKSLGTS
jgi:hypothetical protein